MAVRVEVEDRLEVEKLGDKLPTVEPDCLRLVYRSHSEYQIIQVKAQVKLLTVCLPLLVPLAPTLRSLSRLEFTWDSAVGRI